MKPMLRSARSVGDSKPALTSISTTAGFVMTQPPNTLPNDGEASIAEWDTWQDESKEEIKELTWYGSPLNAINLPGYAAQFRKLAGERVDGGNSSRTGSAGWASSLRPLWPKAPCSLLGSSRHPCALSLQGRVR